MCLILVHDYIHLCPLHTNVSDAFLDEWSTTPCMVCVYNVCENHHLDIQVFQASEVVHQGKDYVQIIIHADREHLDRMNHCGCADCRQTLHVE